MMLWHKLNPLLQEDFLIADVYHCLRGRSNGRQEGHEPGANSNFHTLLKPQAVRRNIPSGGSGVDRGDAPNPLPPFSPKDVDG